MFQVDAKNRNLRLQRIMKLDSQRLEKHSLVFSNVQLSSFSEPVPSVSSDTSSWLRGLEPDAVFCCSASRLGVLCVLRCFSAHIVCKRVQRCSCSSDKYNIYRKYEFLQQKDACTVNTSYFQYKHINLLALLFGRIHIF